MKIASTYYQEPPIDCSLLSTLPDCLKPFFPYPEDDEQKGQNTMTINLTPEQERRIQAVIRRGAYESVEEIVDAALTAVEQLTVPEFAIQ